ncbi:carbohydrate-binding module family 21 protein [Macrolepiota fuliginosa MF-IS2]|uniref:Carbohydrate-binding module family 21 protein n=1 Tax=Macrolepiota fuliginosa MF-IS2 TaxID=1400762 RepID=A0A9P6CA05_9AGAR|nr:carbohydrate-binding module family 21 protein [Macrolepiota fuliginosa MF-IS2]
MIATITVQRPHRVSSQSDMHNSRDSNSAGAPLPIIPRRIARSHSLPTSQSSSSQIFVSPHHHWNQDDSDSDSSSSNVSDASKPITHARRRRVKGVRASALNPPKMPLSPTRQITSSPLHICQPQGKDGILGVKLDENTPPIAAPRPLVYTPGMLRLSLETMRSHMLSDPHTHNPRATPRNGSKSAPPPENNTKTGPQLVIRKKSGQPVKSSLKASRSSTRGNLSVVTIGSSSKSEPPTPKAVHFDAKLEHVKLFLAEQKPLAVSRDGSPTEDTSGTDSDFPTFIYGDDDDTRRSRKRLVMRPVNMPSKPDLDADVTLEDFYLNFDGTNILGKVRVRNVAYAKSVVVRFTFDSWQTTSEVTGRYAESINAQFDRFSFNIRLNDLLARIEGKTFIMAIRYNVGGQELWDNNCQQNYIATFTKAKASRESKRSDDEDASDVENLRSRLEQVILLGKEKSAFSPSPPKKPATSQSKETDPPSLKSRISLASRYDFATSLRNPSSWKPFDVPSRGFPPKEPRTASRPRSSTLPPQLPPSSIPWPEKNSPTKRPTVLPVAAPLHKEEHPLNPLQAANGQSVPAPQLSTRLDGDEDSVASPSSARRRNHQRSHSDEGSLGTNSYVRRTAPSTPPEPSDLELSSLSSVPSVTPSPPSRYHSFPPLMANDSSLSPSSSSPFGLEFGPSTTMRQLFSPPTVSRDFPHGLGSGPGESSGESELSTPNIATPTSSRSATPSPTDPFKKPVLPPFNDDGFGPGSGLGFVHALQPISPGTHYRHFLNKFCFFTGSPASADPTDSGVPSFSCVGQSPRLDVFDGLDTLNPSESVDDLETVRGDSGASTPITSAGKWGSRPATPVP